MRIVLVLALAMTGCPGDDDGDPSNYVPINMIAEAYKQAYCVYATRCGYFPDAATCEGAALGTSTVGAFTNPDANTIAAVGLGHVAYNGTNVKKCFDALAAQTCDKTDKDSRVPNLACRDILRGMLDAGAACTLDAECISGVCSGNSTTSCTKGTCSGSTPPSYVPAQLEMPCTQSRGCVEGAYCELTTDVCTLLKVEGDACQQNTECGYGLMCLNDSATATRACKPAPTLGQPCPDFTCRDDGLYCSTTCKQIGLPPTTCTSSTQCSPYYPCDLTLGQCKKGPSGGMACSSTNRCFDAGTFCDSTTSTCTALKADGAICNIDAECGTNNCDTTMAPAICAAPPTCF